ncbi:pilus assembly PilX N-terminal domain-containing protein [Candidatus Daviesbacteria bacterium]|nr:pilus assembly PilX N-terminal domain-containing protein [Candidatus Daviesbacteria bacterium]
MRNQRGQTVLILILVMTVALAIGISVIQRSLSDLSTSTKVEQSSRAYSAAEAGIEKAIQSGGSITSPIPLGNDSSIFDVQTDLLPAPNQALEYPPLAKEELAQVWLADPTSSTFPNCDVGKICYNESNLDIYWGVPNTTSDKPAIEVIIVYLSGDYQSKKFFLDSDSPRTGSNNFQDVSAGCTNPVIDTSLGSNRTFFCKTTLPGLVPTLMLLRARILYSSISQPFAVMPTSGSLPPQARLFTSTGVSGQTQRKVQVFRLDKVVPPYFDYAIFSAGDINK